MFGVDSSSRFLFRARTHKRVMINGAFSSWSVVLSGILQDSVLGPLLFIIYMNDIVDSGENVNIYLIAADA